MAPDREMDERDHRVALSEAYAAFRATPFPAGGGASELLDADVDLAEEDAYLAGLIETYLSGGRVQQPAIKLSPSIDERLLQASEGSHSSFATALSQYRKQMIGVAEVLSHASGIPLIWSE